MYPQPYKLEFSIRTYTYNQSNASDNQGRDLRALLDTNCYPRHELF